MAERTHARPLTPDDAAILVPIDMAYAARVGLEPVLNRGSVSFYARSDHSFVAVRSGDATGFAVAHAVWNGTRPVVQVGRVAVQEAEDKASLEALLEAVTKSAYDAAVYDLQVHHPHQDDAGRQALHAKNFQAADITLYERRLGSRGGEG